MVFNNGYQTGYRQGYAPAPAAGPNELPRMAAQTTAENPWPVSMVSQKFHSAVERWPAVWMEGQIIEINTRRSGSAYLTLRDNDQDVSMSVLGFGAFAQMARDYKQGDRVVVHGKADLYVKSTRLSLRADMIKRVGAGNLQEQINQLRMRLKGEGLFDESRKVALPEFPKNIGLICAPQARAEGDVVMNVNLRWPGVRFTIVHAHVQGEQCPPDIVSAIQQLDADPNVDVIIVARGGGSFEDLMGFSDERVVRATAACATPIISAIGHEDDWTLIDLAADVRASTPTDAAKRVVPDVREQQQLITEGINRESRGQRGAPRRRLCEPAVADPAAHHAHSPRTRHSGRGERHAQRFAPYCGRGADAGGETRRDPARAEPAIHARPRLCGAAERRWRDHRRRLAGAGGRRAHTHPASRQGRLASTGRLR